MAPWGCRLAVDALGHLGDPPPPWEQPCPGDSWLRDGPSHPPMQTRLALEAGVDRETLVVGESLLSPTSPPFRVKPGRLV